METTNQSPLTRRVWSKGTIVSLKDLAVGASILILGADCSVVLEVNRRLEVNGWLLGSLEFRDDGHGGGF